MSYQDFVSRKFALSPPTGLAQLPVMDSAHYKPHQQALTQWALRRGRAAIFADTGLGKTRMELAWGDAVTKHSGSPVLMLTPLAVAAQAVREAEKLGLTLNHCRHDSDVREGLNVINYDRLHLIDASRFGGVILDESSVIKHHDTRTLATLLEMFAATQFKLAASATPAPNDWTELGTHAEFLGACSRTEMLSEFFVHDGGETQVWRLKGHAQRMFWRWVSSWGAMVRKPSDLGFDDTGYDLPPLRVHEHVVDSSMEAQEGKLFALEASTLSERRTARRGSLEQRVSACAASVNSRDEAEVIWCDLNAESEALTAAIAGAVEIRGSHDSDYKERVLLDFAEGRVKRIVTKPSICGHGLNWQHCKRQSFVGVTDSYESYYQAVRRSWRFGQTKPVDVDIYISTFEGAVLANIKRKEIDSAQMGESLARETNEAVRAEVLGMKRETNSYNANKSIRAPRWLTTEQA